MRPGEFLALVSAGYSGRRIAAPTLSLVGVCMEDAAEAILSVLPLPANDPSPIYCWLDEETGEAASDLAFAVNGLACDAEVRRVGMSVLGRAAFDAKLSQAVLAIRIDSMKAPCGFLLRKGRC